MRLPTTIITDTQDKINGYIDMIESLILTFDDKSEKLAINQINNAILLELISGFAVACITESAVYTNYETRSDGSDAIDKINYSYDLFLNGLQSASVSGLQKDSFYGDHNYLSLLQDTIKKINYVLLNKSFDLKSEKKVTLSENSDIISLCWKYYNSVDSDIIDYFIITNNFLTNEFIEIPAGKEILIYG